MRLQKILLAAVVVLAAGPALAVGGVAGQSVETGQTNAVADQHLDCEYPITVEDATDETVTIEEEPEEVVVLYPNVAQQIWEIGAQEKVVGMPVNENTAYLEGSEQRTHILTEGEGGLMVPNNERIVDLDPDLVLSPSITPPDALEELRASGLTVYHYSGVSDLDGMLAQVERTGQLVGECGAATELTADLADRIDAVEASAASGDRPTVFWDLGDEPSGPFTVNNQSLQHDVITTAGGENVAAEIPAEFGGGYPQISTEVILEADPDIVVAPDGQLSEFPGYEEVAAFENDRIIEVEANFISQHGPRNVDVLEQVAGEIEAMNTENDTATNDTAADADDSGPGFTVGAAVTAVLALVAARLEVAR